MSSAGDAGRGHGHRPMVGQCESCGVKGAVRVGTMGFAYRDWVGPFYPGGTASCDYLSFYGRVFDTVELDTTFYAVPRESAIRNWLRRTDPGFTFAAKLPQSITHDKGLVGAGVREDLTAFLRAMALLGDRAGPLLIQLPPAFRADRLEDARSFLRLLPSEFRFAIEFRHRSWLTEETFDILREHNVALAAIDLYYMPRRIEVTADFAYIRWLGRRADVRTFEKVVIDREAELQEWAWVVSGVATQVRTVYGYFNNHYAGHSPASANRLKRLLGLPAVEPASVVQPTLFDGP